VVVESVVQGVGRTEILYGCLDMTDAATCKKVCVYVCVYVCVCMCMCVYI